MNARESEHLFKEADSLYRAGRYGEALVVLDKLNEAFPDTKNILMPRAMCLVHLGDVVQARAIYERLVARYPAERLSKLRKLLDEAHGPGAMPDALDAVLNVNAADLENARITASPQAVQQARQAKESGAAPPPVPAGPAWGKWASIGAGVVVVLALLSLPLFVQSDGTSQPRERPEMTRIPADHLGDLPEAEAMRLIMVMVFVIFPLALLSLPLPIFLTLLFFGEMPKDSLLLSYLILLAYMFVIYLVTSLIFGCLGLFLGGFAGLGWVIAVLLTVNQIFELGWVRTLIFAGFSAVLWVAQGPIFAVIMRAFYFDVPIW